MSISPFFRDLHSSYQAEMDDLTFDSEGRDVLHQRLTQRRGELQFLLQMIELSPEMVAVIFHKGFHFKLPAVMDHLLTHTSDEFPDWNSIAEAFHLPPWSHDLTQIVLKEPRGEWFLTVAAGLEYMYSKPGFAPALKSGDGDQDDGNTDDVNGFNRFENSEEMDAIARDEAAADWMIEQGFDRKD
jgi:hypothetical protein